MLFEEASLRMRRYLGDKELGGGATQVDITEAEAALGTKLPESYKAFLREFGWGGIGSWELFGLGRCVPEYLNLVRMTGMERTVAHPHIARALIPIMNDGFGNHYCLATASLIKGECPVVFWDHEKGAGQEPKLVSPRFDLWLLDLLRESGI
jgi:cell wall assembly regulator SMI1